jgi:hypothetical protein
VDADESLRLKHGFEPPHSPLPDPGLLMQQLGPAAGVPTGVVHAALQQHVDDLAVLVDGPPQVPLPATDPVEDLVHEDCVAVASSPRDRDEYPSEQILDVTVAEAEAMVEPDRVLDDRGRVSTSIALRLRQQAYVPSRRRSGTSRRPSSPARQDPGHSMR